MGFLVPGQDSVRIIRDPASSANFLAEVSRSLGEDVAGLSDDALRAMDQAFETALAENPDLIRGFQLSDIAKLPSVKSALDRFRADTLQGSFEDPNVTEDGIPLDPGQDSTPIDPAIVRKNFLDSLPSGTRTFAEDILDQLEFSLNRPITAEETANVRTLVVQGQQDKSSVSDVSNQALSSIEQRQSRIDVETFQTDFERLFTEQQAENTRQQDVLNAFLGSGGDLTTQSLAQLFGAETPQAGTDIALAGIAQAEADQLARQAQFEQERQSVADFTRAEGLAAFEAATPFIKDQLQRAGIPQSSGFLAEAFGQSLEDIERGRQSVLNQFSISDIGQLRGIEDLFSQQARGLGLQSGQNIQAQLSNLFGQGQNVLRQDILGGQQFGRGLQAQGLQNLFSSGENQRQRDFEQAQFNQQLQLFNQLAGEQRKASNLGSLFGLGGSGIGALIGGLIPGGGLAGALLGGGLGGSIGGGIGGLFGGTSSGNAGSPFFNALDFLNQQGGRRIKADPFSLFPTA